MSLKHPLLRSLAATALLAGLAFAPTGAAVADDRYATVEPAQPSDTTGKIEVLEFFAYTCPHCFTMEPMTAKWAQTFPDNVAFKRVPVAFNANMADLQKMYYTLEALDRLDLHEKFFVALHRERQRIYTADAMADWAAKQGVDRQQFEAAFNSFGITNKVARANELVKNYNVDSTPTLAVGGKYTTSPGMTGTYEGAITEAQRLLETVLAQ
ncbi:MAG TPA: thiol:disulfide interchange protein DsbA/DsbL [Burkholderiaceae bacterium]|nr:thiol:disulfide interchange protein DsbA/DsbL [Burkholderiaceae bacterium]